MRLQSKLVPLLIALAAPLSATAQVALRDAIYLYNQDLHAGGQMQLGSENCDILQLVMDLDSGYTGLRMDQSNSSADSKPSAYPDIIQNGAKMFSYMLFETKALKSFTFMDPNNPSGTGKIATGTVFGYCLSSNPAARVYLVDRINCVTKSAGNNTQALSACTPTNGTRTTQSLLNASNYVAVAQEVLSSAAQPIGATQNITGTEYVDQGVVFAIARNQLEKVPAYMQQALADNTMIGASSSQTTACPFGGQLTVQATDADNSRGLSAGDSVTISANNCTLAEGTTNGSLGIAYNSLSGVVGSSYYSASVTMTLNDFSVTKGQIVTRSSGSLTLAMSASGTNAQSIAMTSPVITTSGNYSGAARSNSLSNYRVTVSRSPDGASSFKTSLSYSANLTNSTFGAQAISLATTTPLVIKGSDLYPSSGVLVITSADNSRIKVTAVSSSQATVELDANGDGIYESSSSVAWNTLM